MKGQLMLATKFRILRKQHLISRKALAAQLEVPPKLVAQWESGEAVPDSVVIARLTILLDTTADYLTNDEIMVVTPGRLRFAFNVKIISIIVVIPLLLGIKGSIEGLVIRVNLNNVHYGLEQENIKTNTFIEMDVSREQFWGKWDGSRFLPFVEEYAGSGDMRYTIRLDKANDLSISFIAQKEYVPYVESILRNGGPYHFSGKIIKHKLFYEGIAMFLSPDDNFRLADIVLNPDDKKAIAEIVSPNFAITTFDIEKEKRILNNGLGWLFVAALLFLLTSVTLERKG
jgi:transcriptional regulator with XRE-family HTH domain